MLNTVQNLSNFQHVCNPSYPWNYVTINPRGSCIMSVSVRVRVEVRVRVSVRVRTGISCHI